MGRQDVLSYVRDQYGVEPDYPWGDDNAVLRHPGNRKWFGLCMNIGYDKLGLPGGGTVEVLNIKCDPLLSGALRQKPGIHPAYHMNKEQWITIRLDGSVELREVEELIDLSYHLTAPKRRGGRKNHEENIEKGCGK